MLVLDIVNCKYMWKLNQFGTYVVHDTTNQSKLVSNICLIDQQFSMVKLLLDYCCSLCSMLFIIIPQFIAIKY